MKKKMNFVEATEHQERLQKVIAVLEEIYNNFGSTGIIKTTKPHSRLLSEFEPELKGMIEDRLNKRKKELESLQAAITGLEIEFETD